MKIIGALILPWTILMGIIELGIAYLCFDKFTAPFETILLGIIGLLYLKLKGKSTGATSITGLWHSQTEFVKIRKLLNDPTVDEEEVQQAEHLVKWTVVQGWVQSIFDCLIGLIIFWHLIKVLL